jgi:hypothetical protein
MYRETLKRIKELAAKLQNSGLSASELRELETLRQAKMEYEQETRNQMGNFRRQHPELIWETFSSKHPEVANDTAHRQALENRASSLSDDGFADLEHLNEALQLLIQEGTIKPKKVLTAAELTHQAAKDSQTFQQAAIQLGFAANTANENLVRQVLGSGYSVSDIAQAISSNAVRLSPVGEAERQQRDEKERRYLIGEILDDYAVDENLREAKRRQLDRPDMTLQNLRQQVAVIRERTRLHQLTPTQIREENARRATQQASTEKPINVAGALHGIAKQDYPAMPDVIWHQGKEVPLDSRFFRLCSGEQMKILIKKYGDAQVVARVRKDRPVEVFGA